jgi:hypothetical protein
MVRERGGWTFDKRIVGRRWFGIKPGDQRGNNLSNFAAAKKDASNSLMRSKFALAACVPRCNPLSNTMRPGSAIFALLQKQ